MRYGVFKYHGVQRPAHRVAWELTNGTIFDGLLVCHRCDNPPCCNPTHLFLGTQKDNIADRDSKGRRTNLGGSRNGLAKLTEDDVHWIRRLAADGTSQRDIAKSFDVSQSAVSLIVLRKTWTHIP